MPIENNKRLRLLMLPLMLLSAGCASSRPVMLHRAVVCNATPVELREVSVRHDPSGKGGSVSAILPGRTLDVGFSQQPLLSDRAVLSWRIGHGPVQTRSLSLRFDPPQDQSPQILVYTIHADGDATARLVSDLAFDLP